MVGLFKMNEFKLEFIDLENYKVLNKNGVLMGFISFEPSADGFVFWPKESRKGFWSEYMLKEILQLIEELDKI